MNASEGGGLAGGNGTGASITDSYAMASVPGTGSGGLIGNDNSSNATVTNSYSTGAVGINNNGGFACAAIRSTTSKDYWDTDTSGTTFGLCEDGNIPEVTGLTTEQLQSGLPSGFSSKVWAEDPNINGEFPYLINNPPEQK